MFGLAVAVLALTSLCSMGVCAFQMMETENPVYFLGVCWCLANTLFVVSVGNFVSGARKEASRQKKQERFAGTAEGDSGSGDEKIGAGGWIGIGVVLAVLGVGVQRAVRIVGDQEGAFESWFGLAIAGVVVSLTLLALGLWLRRDEGD